MRRFRAIRPVLGLLALALPAAAVAGPVKPPAVPAKIQIAVSPEGVAPGGQASVTVQLRPIDGIKINRYPKIKLEVPEQPLLGSSSELQIGNDAPPPPESADDNYFDEVDPLELSLEIDDDATAGEHEVEGKLTYYYCVIASGFCAPARVQVKIPVVVR
jgi:hypothetical protein